jgi:sec-independent protein translocase protein TatA
MVGDLFDSPWKILIVAVVIIVLFGSKKLPDAARSLGRSMRILKKEVGSMHEDEPDPGVQAQDASPAAQVAPAQLTAAPAAAADQRGQIDALQQQIRDLQRAAAMDTPASAGVAMDTPASAGVAAESRHTQPG